MRRAYWILALGFLAVVFLGFGFRADSQQNDKVGPYVVLGFNDLGMHCCNQDFSEFMILPPFNTLHAQVIDRTNLLPRLVTEGITVSYSIPGNTESATKTNFWQYVKPLLGLDLPLNIGLTGNGLSGWMAPTGKDWVATGIPLTPMTDLGVFDPFQLANVKVQDAHDAVIAETNAVTPVSWELACALCHHGPPDAPVSVLDAHDRLHGTTLFQAGNQPVLCGGCHAQPELGLPGVEGRESLSLAMHKAHAPRMMDVVGSVPKGNVCFACHPGPQIPCLRDVHVRRQMQCNNCHAQGVAPKDIEGWLLAVGDPARRPWVDLPRCDNCHRHPGWDYEQSGMLFKNSVGHGGLYCEACHNSTHAIVPAEDAADNVQSIALQHHAGTIRKCDVCHAYVPYGIFRHKAPATAAAAARNIRNIKDVT